MSRALTPISAEPDPRFLTEPDDGPMSDDEAAHNALKADQDADDPPDVIVRTLDLLCLNAPVALAALHRNNWMEWQYFDRHDDAAAWARALPETIKAVYTPLNPFTKTSTGHGITAKDITRRRWFLIDCDPNREQGTNATDDELGLAHDVSTLVRAYLASHGWPDPIIATSGNGAHLIYLIDLPNDAESTALLTSILKHLAKYNTPGVSVDQTTADACQLTKVYGSITRKGPATTDRPHRRSDILTIPDRCTGVPLAALQAIRGATRSAGAATQRPFSREYGLYDLEAILAKLTIYDGPRDRDGYREWQIRCGWAPEHSDPDSEHGTIFTWSDAGAPGFTCPHDHCQDRKWPALRDLLGITPKDLILKAEAPLTSAEIFVVRAYTADDVLALRHQAGQFYDYRLDAGCYRVRDEAAVRADLYRFLKGAKQWTNHGTKAHPDLKLDPFDPNKNKVENVLDALRGITNLPLVLQPPCWLVPRSGLDPIDLLAFPNGILHVPTRTLSPSTPELFTLNGLDFPYDPDAREPTIWNAFLKALWKDDTQSMETLQEIFGYLLTPDTGQQKIFMIIGPRRSGKGIIGRIVRRMVGVRNACSPTLAQLDEPTGKQVLIEKMLAVISDARISTRTDTAKVAEALLSTSGEDAQTVRRKYLDDWSGNLYVRWVILTNELPDLNDPSGALAGRFILLHLIQSFYGQEDPLLFAKLAPELPSILNWALDGRDRLYRRGHFIQPESAAQIVQEFVDLGSPTASFLRERTVIKAGATVSQPLLFADWTTWCTERGRDKPGTAQTFARDVRSVLPWIKTKRLGGRGQQEQHWLGLGLVAEPVPVPQPVRRAPEF